MLEREHKRSHFVLFPNLNPLTFGSKAKETNKQIHEITSKQDNPFQSRLSRSMTRQCCSLSSDRETIFLFEQLNGKRRHISQKQSLQQ